MTGAAITLFVGFLLLVVAAVKPLGLYMANVFEGRPIWPVRAGAALERAIYRVCGVEPAREMGWREYAVGLLLFNALGAVAVYLLQRCQLWLPLNPQRFANLGPDSAFNTAVSFVTNTNWQGYSGESAMSYLTQMAGLAVQNFLSAASGIVVAIVLIRGLRDAVRAAAARDGAGARSGIPGRDPELQCLQGRDHSRAAHLPAAEDR